MRTHRILLPGTALTAIRPGRDEDGPAFIALIARCWSDYPGVELHVEEEEPDLLALATHFRRAGGMLWIVGAGTGMVATRPGAGGAWEICRMYVHPDLHGTGMAAELLALAEGYSEAGIWELWSDTRFTRAHRFYEKHGYRRSGQVRDLHDRSSSSEFHFIKRG